MHLLWTHKIWGMCDSVIRHASPSGIPSIIYKAMHFLPFSHRGNLLHCQHIAASKGYKDCILVLLKHGCNVNIQDLNGDTPLWDAISAKHHSIFGLLYYNALVSNLNVSGDLLCLAAKRNDLSTMKELLRHGLEIDSMNIQGFTALKIAIAENHTDMVSFLLMNGASINNIDAKTLHEMENEGQFSVEVLEKIVQKREVGHRITVMETPAEALGVPLKQQEQACNNVKTGGLCTRVSIYRGHPQLRDPCTEAGKLIRLPNSIEDLRKVAGEKFGFDASNTVVANEEGSEVDSIEVIRDNDKLFIIRDEDYAGFNAQMLS